MKRILSIIAFLGIAATSVFAQDTFKGHWFIQAQGGAAETVGETKFKDLISPTAALSVGYQFSPIFGVRLNANGWQGKGAVANPATVYSFNHVTGSFDLLIDLDNVFASYKADRLFNPYLLLGVGAAGVMNNDEANALKAQLPADNLLWDGTKVLPMGKVGLGLNIRLCDWCAFNIEANNGFYPDKFNSKRGSKADFQLGALAGFTFRLGAAKKAAPAAVAPVEPVKEELVVEEKEPVKVEEPAPIVDTKEPQFEGMTKNIYFMINKWVIRPAEQVKIDEVVEVLKANPDTKVKVSGHADKATGNARINKFLSEKRSEIVSQALMNAGIAADRIITESFGDTANPYSTPEENRVAICVVK